MASAVGMCLLAGAGGSSVVGREIGRGLRDRGVGVHYCHCDRQSIGDPSAVALTLERATALERILDTDRVFTGAIDVCTQMIDWYRRARFGVLHAHFLPVFGVPAYFLKRLFGVPYVITFHGTDLASRHLLDSQFDMAREILVHADAVTCVSEYLAQIYRRHFPDLPPPRVIHNFLRHEFRSSRAARSPVPLRILHASSLRPVKRPELLLAAFARFHARHPGAELRLATTPSGVGRARSLRRELGFGDEVTAVDCGSDVEALRDEYRSAAAFVITSRYESFGLVILEALAHGVPVVAPAVGGIPEVVGHDWPFLVADADDPDAYADALSAALVRDDWRDRAGAILRRFDPQRQIERYIDAYRAVAGGGR